MTTANKVYLDILKKWDAPESQRVIKIMEATFSPEEGEVLLELMRPATCRDVAGRLKADEKKVYNILEKLADRGIITKGKTEYCFHSSLIAFHHHVVGGVAAEPVPEKIEALWADFFRNEWCDMFVETYKKRLKDTGWPVHRVWPHVGALELSPNIKPEQILRQENFKLFLESAKKIVVGHCGCRKNWSNCEHPVETCFAPMQGGGAAGLFFLSQPKRTSIREVSLAEALEIVKKNEEAGLVNTGACFCCTCSCEILYSVKKAKRFDLVGRSRFEAAVDEEKCIGCQDCVERCPFEAIEMKKPAGSKKLKASIIPENCMGCGVCIIGCKQRALRFEIVRPPAYILAPRPDSGQVGIMCYCTGVK
jgi:ferredoxin